MQPATVSVSITSNFPLTPRRSKSTVPSSVTELCDMTVITAAILITLAPRSNRPSSTKMRRELVLLLWPCTPNTKSGPGRFPPIPVRSPTMILISRQRCGRSLAASLVTRNESFKISSAILRVFSTPSCVRLSTVSSSGGYCQLPTVNSSTNTMRLTPGLGLFGRVNKDLGSKLQQRTEAAIQAA